jgi:murein DD-endopeptidase MepM/ murein hydrolase activator NlpD
VIGVVAVLGLLAPTCYMPPITSPVVDPFRAPACQFCPGNRGLEYEPAIGTKVVAAAAGVVTFSGLVAGVRYVVVEQDDGRLATYGRLAAAKVVVGASVAVGDQIGTTTERFYFGLRDGDQYIDPAPFLGTLRSRPRLIPTDGSPPRPAPAPTLSCARSP